MGRSKRKTVAGKRKKVKLAPEDKIVMDILRDPDFADIHQDLRRQLEGNARLMQRLQKTKEMDKNVNDVTTGRLTKLMRRVQKEWDLPEEIKKELASALASERKCVGATMKLKDKRMSKLEEDVSTCCEDLRTAKILLKRLANKLGGQEADLIASVKTGGPAQNATRETECLDDQGAPYFLPRTLHLPQLRTCLDNSKDGIKYIVQSSMFKH